MKLILAMLISLLPGEYRRRASFACDVDPVRGALFSGILQCAGCALVFCFRYLYFLQHRVGQFADNLIGKGAEEAMGSTAVQWGAGMVSLGEYLIHPVSLALIYFALEGLVRWMSPLIHAEAVGTMPLQLVAWAHVGIRRAKLRRELGPVVEDEVQAGDGRQFALRIASSRPKPWTKLTTISYDDALYELIREERAAAPRSFVYLLRPRRESKIIRGLYHYDPREALKKS